MGNATLGGQMTDGVTQDEVSRLYEYRKTLRGEGSEEKEELDR